MTLITRSQLPALSCVHAVQFIKDERWNNSQLKRMIISSMELMTKRIILHPLAQGDDDDVLIHYGRRHGRYTKAPLGDQIVGRRALLNKKKLSRQKGRREIVLSDEND